MSGNIPRRRQNFLRNINHRPGMTYHLPRHPNAALVRARRDADAQTRCPLDDPFARSRDHAVLHDLRLASGDGDVAQIDHLVLTRFGEAIAVTVEINEDSGDDAVLARLLLTLHDGHRAWKGHNWDGLGRLPEQGRILDPVGKAESVVLTSDGVRRSEDLLKPLFTDAPKLDRTHCDL